MSRAPKVRTSVVVHSIREEDLQAALDGCCCLSFESFLRKVDRYRMERELEVLRERIRAVVAQMDARLVQGKTVLGHLEAVQRLEKERDALLARWREVTR